jgi:hypothetical protein
MARARLQAHGAGAAGGRVDQAAGMALPALGWIDGKFAEIERIEFRGKEEAGHGRGADGPDLAPLCLRGDAAGGQAVQRGGRIDPPVHGGKGPVQEREQRGPVVGITGLMWQHGEGGRH